MVRTASGLPVHGVPEQHLVALVRNSVVDHLGRRRSTYSQTAKAPWRALTFHRRFLIPLRIIATLAGAASPPVILGIDLPWRALPLWSEGGRSNRHLSHERKMGRLDEQAAQV